jgi:chemotaxis protein methyltransferase CheR
MTAGLAHDEIERFHSAVTASTGMTFAADRQALLGAVLSQRLGATGCVNVGDYLRTLSPRSGETAELAKLLTVSETYFFRNVAQFRVAESYLDALRVSLAKRLRVLSAGCSTGEEAYTAALLVHQRLADFADWSVSIRGIDLNPDVLQKAVLARYSSWALRETPRKLRERYFAQHGSSFTLVESVRGLVAFEQRNLIDPDPQFWQPQGYDIVFCRNVLMYLAMDAAERIVASIASALVPGGLLFLGHAENLRGLSTEFRLRHSHGTFYYERNGASLLPAEKRGSRLAAGPREWATKHAWFEAIDRSSARVTALMAPSTAQAVRQQPPHASVRGVSDTHGEATDRSAPRAHLVDALALIGEERFADAFAALAALPSSSNEDPDVLLLRAVLLTCSGHPSAAEGVCARLLVLDELNAGANYVIALCREHAADIGQAIRHDRTSIDLDPEFAMPRLHLGRLLRRRGDPLAAHCELGTAARLLEREDASRIALFGGGFTRDGLIALCRAEQNACERAA